MYHVPLRITCLHVKRCKAAAPQPHLSVTVITKTDHTCTPISGLYHCQRHSPPHHVPCGTPSPAHPWLRVLNPRVPLLQVALRHPRLGLMRSATKAEEHRQAARSLDELQLAATYAYRRYRLANNHDATRILAYGGALCVYVSCMCVVAHQ
jgi:hypothetical protein